MITFGVFLIPVGGGAATFETVEADAERHAIRVAEHMHPGYRATAVTSRFEVLGLCWRCGVIVFTHERHRRDPSGVRCEDC